MKRTRSLFFTIVFAILTLVTVVCLTACNPKQNVTPDNNNPDNNGDQPVYGAITEQEAQELLSTVKIDWTNNVMIESDGEVSAKVGDNYYVSYGTQKHYLIKQDGEYYSISEDTDPYHLLSKVYRLQPSEAQARINEYQNYFLGPDLDLVEIYNMYKAYSSEAREDMGTDFVESVSGEKNADGFIVRMSTIYNDYDYMIPIRYSIDVTINNDRQITGYTQYTSAVDGWHSDDVDVDYYAYGGVITVRYGSEVQVGFPNLSAYASGDLDPMTQKVTLDVRNQATMPTEFNNQLTPGAIVTLPDPTNNADNFLGWYYDSDLVVPVTNNQFEVSYSQHDQSVYAKWKNYLEVELNGGTFMDAYDVQRVSRAICLNDIQYIRPMKAGYEFVGWYTDAELTEPAVYSSTLITEPTKLYAKYQQKVVLKLEANSNYKMMSARGLAGNNFYYSDPVKKGYLFDGWYTDAELTTPFTSNKFPTENMTLYAKYREALAVNIDLGFAQGRLRNGIPYYLNLEKTATVSELEAILQEYVENDDYDIFMDMSDPNDTKYMLRWAADKNGTKVTALTNDMTVYAYRTSLAPIAIVVHKDGALYINNDNTYSVQEHLFKPQQSLYELVIGYLTDLYNNDNTLFKYNYALYIDANHTVELTAETAYGDTGASAYIVLTKKPHYSFDFRNQGKYWAIQDQYTSVDNTAIVESEGLYYCDVETMLNMTPAQVFVYLGLVPEDSEDYRADTALGYIAADGDYYFAGWYTDENCTAGNEYVPGDAFPTASLTLYAKYLPVPKLYFANGTAYADVSVNVTHALYDFTSEKYYVSYLAFAQRENKGQTLVQFLTANYTGEEFTGTHDADNYEVEGIYSDAACTTPYDAATFPTDNATVYLKWQAVV